MPAEDNAPMIDRSRYDYSTVRVADPKTGKVRHSTGNGDAVARAMLAITADDLPKLVKKNGLPELKHGSNPGQFRMIVGNSLRAKVRKGEEVTIGDVVVKKLDQREPVIKEAPLVERKLAAEVKTRKAPNSKTKQKNAA